MSWFITSIIGEERLKKNPEYKSLRTRTFGFYNELIHARNAIESNEGNIEDCMYDYVVIEYIEPGIHPLVLIEEWYQWNEEEGKWVLLHKKPEEFNGICNFALG